MALFLDRPYRVVFTPIHGDPDNESWHCFYAKDMAEAKFIEADFNEKNPGLYNSKIEEVPEHLRRHLQAAIDKKNNLQN